MTRQISGTIDGIFNFGPTNISKDDVVCAPKLSGSGFSCEATSGGLPLPGAIGPIPAIPPFFFVAKLAIGAEFNVTPEGAVVRRSLTAGGTSVPGPSANPGPLDLVTSPSVETFTMPCTAKAGDAVDYDLSDYHWTPATTATQQDKIRIVAALDPLGAAELFDVTSFDIGPAQVSSPAFDLASTGFLTSMGGLLPNNVNPTIGALGPFSGSEGTPIAFSASVKSQCPIGSYVWESRTALSRSVHRRSAPSPTTACTTVS